MAFLNGSVQLQIYTDSAQTAFPKLNLPSIVNDFTNSVVAGALPLYINLAALGTQAINLNGLTGVTEFYIFSDAAALSLTLNGGSPVTVKQSVPGYVPFAVTSMSITNNSSSVATNVTLILIKG